MSIAIKKKLEYADRFAVQQADQAIRKDVVRALVELITNCNDSYNRMEDAGIATTGKITIEVQRRHSNTVLRVCDNAEGMTPDDLDKKVLRYGEATSGFKEGRSVRGLWGRGLKDSFFGLGYGSVNSIRDGLFNRCSLSVVNGAPTYQRQQSQRATRPIKNQYELLIGNGTVMEITVSRDDVSVPQFDNLRRKLERHFELRAIMSSANRTVLLREVDNPEVLVLTPQVRIDLREDYTGVGEARVELEGRQVGAEAVIIATINGIKAEAMVKVISKREPPGERRPKKEHGGLFRDVKFDPTEEPKQRVRFDRANAIIIIATKVPSVAAYLDEHGGGTDTPQGQVLFAELVTEAVCFEIARRGVESGKFLAISGAEADAIRREHVNLQNKYAHKIHECFVDANHRRAEGQPVRKGRPTRETLLANAVVSSD
jgi:hypothetical protein